MTDEEKQRCGDKQQGLKWPVEVREEAFERLNRAAAAHPLEPAMRALGEGVKHDEAKLPMHLLPFDALKVIAQVLLFGAQKYGDRNWEKGMARSRLFSAAMRHLTDWWERKGPDEETGYSHLWHAGCCVLFLIAYEIRGIGEDDRP